MTTLSVQQNDVVELILTANQLGRTPGPSQELTAIITDPEGRQRSVPGFWAGGQVWKIRYSATKIGIHHFQTHCSDAPLPDLQSLTGTLEVVPYRGENPLFSHGALAVSADHRYLQHQDGTPFFWLADTWWMGLCDRLSWDEFKWLTADRVEKGFSVIQLVAGLYPDMAPFDQRGRNQTGFPWQQDWSTLNPGWFEAADRRIQHLVASGLVPCILGSWGYYLEFAGQATLQHHWRHLVARWGAYPVVWCMAGEMLMPWYLHSFTSPTERQAHIQAAQKSWQHLTQFLRQTDPWQRLVTTHPGGGSSSRQALAAHQVDFNMLQTGHGGFNSLPNTVKLVTTAVEQQPKMPVINAEVCYEGIGGTCWPDVQRLMFWVCLLSGTAGHTYGANGVWQVNRREAPFGPSPTGIIWGNTPWDVAANWEGGRQVGVGRRILERYDWWRLEPTPDLVSPRWTERNYHRPYAATIPGQCHLVYLPRMEAVTLRLPPGGHYRPYFVDPATGQRYDLESIVVPDNGIWTLPGWRPLFQDMVLVVEWTEDPENRVMISPPRPQTRWRSKAQMLVYDLKVRGKRLLNKP